jgi:hypothetical protein
LRATRGEGVVNRRVRGDSPSASGIGTEGSKADSGTTSRGGLENREAKALWEAVDRGSKVSERILQTLQDQSHHRSQDQMIAALAAVLSNQQGLGAKASVSALQPVASTESRVQGTSRPPYKRACFKCGSPDHLSPNHPPSIPELPWAEQQKLKDEFNMNRQANQFQGINQSGYKPAYMRAAGSPASGSNAVPLGSSTGRVSSGIQGTPVARHVTVDSEEESDVEEEMDADRSIRSHGASLNARMTRFDSLSPIDSGDSEGSMSHVDLTRRMREERRNVRMARGSDELGSGPMSLDTEDAERLRKQEAAAQRKRKEEKARMADPVGAKPRGEKREKVRPKPKALERLQGMVGHDSFDFHDWLVNTKVEMSVLQYLQQSPSARRDLGWEMALANPGKRGKKKRRNEFEEGVDEGGYGARYAPLQSELDDDSDLVDSGDEDGLFSIRHLQVSDLRPSRFGSFYVTLKIRVGRKVMVFSKVVLDPGSDINLVTEDTAANLGLSLAHTKGTMMSGMAMRTADGARTRLRQFSVVQFQLAEATWEQEFFVLPTTGPECGFSFLLGLPWLYDAWAVFDIRSFNYTINTPDRQLVVLEGPAYRPERFCAIEYPTRVDRFEKETGGYKERYIYDDEKAVWNPLGGGQPPVRIGDTAYPSPRDEPKCRLNGIVEMQRADGVLTESVAMAPFTDAVTYLSLYGASGSSSQDAKEWVRGVGGEEAASEAVDEMLRSCQVRKAKN